MGPISFYAEKDNTAGQTKVKWNISLLILSYMPNIETLAFGFLLKLVEFIEGFQGRERIYIQLL
jgi:hypothetical protein